MKDPCPGLRLGIHLQHTKEKRKRFVQRSELGPDHDRFKSIFWPPRIYYEKLGVEEYKEWFENEPWIPEYHELSGKGIVVRNQVSMKLSVRKIFQSNSILRPELGTKKEK